MPSLASRLSWNVLGGEKRKLSAFVRLPLSSVGYGVTAPVRDFDSVFPLLPPPYGVQFSDYSNRLAAATAWNRLYTTRI